MKRIGLMLFAGLFACISCMENPLDYPLLKAEITAFEVEGQKSVTIDAANQVVNVVLQETADMSALPLLKYAYTESAVPSEGLPPVLDLTEPIKISYQTYPDQTYEWTVKAVQPIERYVKCDNMIGEAEFDVEKREITAYFPEEQNTLL